MKNITVTAYILVLAAIGFWMSWFLMPDPGTTDTVHILAIVKQARTGVVSSVVIQIISSVLYIIALFPLVQHVYLLRKITLTGFILLVIGCLGLCADAFFHLLAWYMTDDSVNIQQDVITVMNFMQTGGVAFLLPLLLPFFIGCIVLAIGLGKQGVTSMRSANVFIAALIIGIAGAIVSKIFPAFKLPGITLTVLGIFAAGQILMAIEIIRVQENKKVLTTVIN